MVTIYGKTVMKVELILQTLSCLFEYISTRFRFNSRPLVWTASDDIMSIAESSTAMTCVASALETDSLQFNAILFSKINFTNVHFLLPFFQQ